MLPLANEYVRFSRSAISAATPVEFKMPQLDSNQLWERFKKYYTEFPSINLSLDISRMNFTEEFIEEMRPRLAKAFRNQSSCVNVAKGVFDWNIRARKIVAKYPELAYRQRQIADFIELCYNSGESQASRSFTGYRGNTYTINWSADYGWTWNRFCTYVQRSRY